MDHIATTVNKDSADVKMANLRSDDIKQFSGKFREAVQYDQRREAILKFNKVCDFLDKHKISYNLCLVSPLTEQILQDDKVTIARWD